MIELEINGEQQRLDVPEDMPLLWVLRDVVGLIGTKYGCGIAQCGACTVHLDGVAVRACATPVGSVAGRSVRTALLARNPDPSDDEIDSAMSGNYCRCGTYNRIRKAIRSAAGTMNAGWVDAAAAEGRS